MRYIRFLKAPRITYDKGRKSAQVSGLVSITSDLGDSFLPCDLTLFVELIQPTRLDVESNWESDLRTNTRLVGLEPSGTTSHVMAWTTAKWTQGMRSLPISLPLSRNFEQKGAFIVRLGTEPKSESDDFDSLLQRESRGVISVWSGPLNLPNGLSTSSYVERRFRVGHRIHRISEETGESIARHVW